MAVVLTGTVPSMVTFDASHQEIVRHRACDECRTRKLACSKNQAGCARCKRDGLACCYSAQKRMGRPKKTSLAQANQRLSTVPLLTPAPVKRSSMEMQDDTWPSMSDDSMQGISMDPSGPAYASIDFTTPFLAPPASKSPKALKPSSRAWPMGPGGIWNAGNGEINMDPDSHSSPSSSASPPALTREDSAASPASSQATTPEDTSAPRYITPIKPCKCRSNLCTALESISQIPSSLTPAICTTRDAARAVYNTITCPSCFPTDPTHNDLSAPPPTFQPLVMLSAILPSIVDAYSRILSLIDLEHQRLLATSTISHPTRVKFLLEDYGGFWFSFCDSKQKSVDDIASMELSPTEWRLVTRALLRIDVYGIHCSKAGKEGSSYVELEFLGLKDVVAMMEKAAREKTELDGDLKSGLMPYGLGVDQGREESHVQRSLAVAVKAVESLCIP